jgi:hypothetical protein
MRARTLHALALRATRARLPHSPLAVLSSECFDCLMGWVAWMGRPFTPGFRRAACVPATASTSEGILGIATLSWGSTTFPDAARFAVKLC